MYNIRDAKNESYRIKPSLSLLAGARSGEISRKGEIQYSSCVYTVLGERVCRTDKESVKVQFIYTDRLKFAPDRMKTSRWRWELLALRRKDLEHKCIYRSNFVFSDRDAVNYLFIRESAHGSESLRIQCERLWRVDYCIYAKAQCERKKKSKKERNEKIINRLNKCDSEKSAWSQYIRRARWWRCL